MHAEPVAGALWLFLTPFRWTPDIERVFTFTTFQQPGQTDDLFESRRAALTGALANLVRQFARWPLLRSA
jgi:hypothetical protein